MEDIMRELIMATEDYLSELDKRLRTTNMDMSGLHGGHIHIHPGEADRDYWHARWKLDAILEKLVDFDIEKLVERELARRKEEY